MQNFVFHNPTKIIFGRNTIAKIGEETAQFGKKALFVYGQQSIKNNGIYSIVSKSLARAGLEIYEHGGVRSNPVASHIREAINFVKDKNIETVVGVGGGSVIDSAKAIAAGALVDHDVWQFFRGKKSIKKALPVTCVLTLAAAGSEMNSGMVLTNEKTSQKLGIGNKQLYPKVSILDPTATFTTPQYYTAYGAVDAMSHVLEFYFTAQEPHTPVQDRIIEGLVINLMESCDQALAEPEDYHARSNLMWCSTLALNGITAAGLGRVGFPMHAIEHSLSAMFDVPHGAGLAVVMTGWMHYEVDQKPQKIAQFGERIFGINQDSQKDKAIQAIEHLKRWLKSVKCPITLADLDIPQSAIPEIAQNSLAQAKLWRLADLKQEKIEAILRLCT